LWMGFAHNDDVLGIMRDLAFKLEHHFPVGKSDFEYAFCYIMDKLELGGDIESIIKVSRAIWSLTNRIGGYGRFNFLPSNGDYFFAYMNKLGTLHYLLRHSSHKGWVKLMMNILR